MLYRRLGSAGLKLSLLSYGSWVTFKTQIGSSLSLRCMEIAHEHGVNFFDNAEAYAHGQSEMLMGEALKKLNWRRESYVVSSKFFWGLNDGINQKNTLNRKYLLQAINGSLKRFQLDFLDLIFCHRPDAETPIEETVWAMHDIISSGKALYWGTSEWSAKQIAEAYAIADKHHLHKPQMEQPQYNLFCRHKVEKEFANLYETTGLGLTIWSPLASGILTGKYNNGIPKDSRLNLSGFEWLQDNLTPDKLSCVQKLDLIAKELGCSLAQLAIAWCAKNPHVSTVILGASKPEQLSENLKAIDVLEKMDDQILKKVDAICPVGE